VEPRKDIADSGYLIYSIQVTMSSMTIFLFVTALLAEIAIEAMGGELQIIAKMPNSPR